MSSPSEPESLRSADDDPSSLMKEDLVELRRLLLGPWQTEVERLKQRLDDPGLHAREIGGVLPEAVTIRSSRDGKLAAALEPTVEEILKASVKKDPKTLGDALFPVMGPAIRKAIFETVKRMIQSFDHIIGQSFSWQGLKWRIEALRTGKSFGEVVLFHSLLYRVEQVFLIHRETGLLLQHVVAEWATAQEPDMVSGMLTAIQDFIHDSFRTERDDTLDAVQMGELTLWVEQGPLAVLAGVIRGNPPESLRQSFVEVLENIHLEQRQALETFQGDDAPFEAVRPYLESCLWAQYKPGEKKLSPLTVLILLVLAVAFGWWGISAVHDNLRWAGYVKSLQAEPGIVIIESGKRDGQWFISGLRDPLAKDPEHLLNAAKVDRQEVAFHWEPYYALNDRFILTRARMVLNPPETVALTFSDGVLTAEGSAPHHWLHKVWGRPPAIPGLVAFREKDLVDRDMEELRAVQESIEGVVLRFETGNARLLPDQSGTVGDLVEQTRRFQLLTMEVGVGFRMEVVGHADASGLKVENLKLSQKRADEIRALLVSKGIDAAFLSAVGAGSAQPVRQEFSEQDRGFNRSVTFKLRLKASPEQKS